MTSQAVEQALSKLDEAIAAVSVRRIDEAVEHVVGLEDAEANVSMLVRLRDDFKFEEGMWTIVHAAECVQSQTYIPLLLEKLPSIRERAPIWASTLIIRLLNSEQDREILKIAIRLQEEQKKTAFAQTLADITSQYPGDFEGKIAYLARP